MLFYFSFLTKCKLFIVDAFLPRCLYFKAYIMMVIKSTTSRILLAIVIYPSSEIEYPLSEIYTHNCRRLSANCEIPLNYMELDKTVSENKRNLLNLTPDMFSLLVEFHFSNVLGSKKLIASSRMFCCLMPSGASQSKDIQASALKHHKAICPILIPIIKSPVKTRVSIKRIRLNILFFH